MTTIDGRERSSHRIADGQTVDADEPFIVGGEEMDSPHDLNGSPENVINCRCRSIPNLDEVIALSEAKENETFIGEIVT